MKKAILSALLAGSAVIASCNKEATTTKPTPTRFISYEMAGSTMYTRAPSSNEVLSIISEALPEHVATVFSGTKTLVVNTGEYTQIPSDTYQVSGTFLGEQYGGILSSDCGGVSLQPAVRINQTLTINDEETQYSLTGSYFCFALVWDATVVDRITFNDAYGQTHEMPYLSEGDTRLVFVQGNLETNYLTLTVYPIDTETYKETEFTIATKQLNGICRAEFGKWYMLTPSFGGNQPKWIALDLPPFTQGEF